MDEQIDTWFDLTVSQDRIYLGQRFFGCTAEYNLTFSFAFTGPVRVDYFQRAFARLASEAECLRLGLKTVEGHPIQRVLPEIALELEVLDFSRAVDSYAAFTAWVSGLAREEVDTARLVRGTWLALLDDHTALWVLSVHHFAADSWGLYLLYRRLKEIYESLLSGQEPSGALPPLRLFFEADQQYRTSPAFQEDQQYWRGKLALAPGPVYLYGKTGTGKIRPSRRVEFDLDPTLVAQLWDQAARSAPADGPSANIRLFNLLLAAFTAYLYRASAQRELMIGVPHLNRPGDLREVPGLSMCVAPVYIPIGEEQTFRELLELIQSESAETARHSRYPIPNPENQLYNTLFNFHNRPYSGPQQIETWWYSGQDSNDLVLNVLNPDPTNDRLTLAFDLCDDLFPAGQEEKVIRHFVHLLTALLRDPDCRLDEVEMLSEAEIRQVVRDFNPVLRQPSGRLVADMLAESFTRFAERAAIESADGQLTYAELDRLSSRLAHVLRQHGAGPGVAVGLHAGRSLEMMTAFVAIFKSGAALVPMDPTYPDERLAYMIENAGIRLVLSSRDQRLDLSGSAAQVLDLQQIWEELPGVTASEELPALEKDHLAYINYTSGSTGRPKGVMITHGALASYLEVISARFQLTPTDRLFYFCAFGSDATYQEIFPILLAGGVLVLKPERLLSLAEFNQLVESKAISIISLPAAYWGEWVAGLVAARAALPPALRMVQTYAEEPRLQRYLEWRTLPGAERVRWINTYGPTETIVTTTTFEPGMDDTSLSQSTRMPIGFSLDNHQVYILDRTGRPVAQGVPGEIVIGGDIGLGYLGRPEETAARFVPDTISGIPGSRLYRTGDRGRHLPDGNIEFLGRLDTQIKVNGFRIEPGEIENRLLAYPGVRQAAVALKPAPGGNRRLVAYLTSDPGTALNPADIQSFLHQSLPDYMVPGNVILLPEMPLNPHGKVNRLALPDVTETGAETAKQGAQTALEGQLLAIWADVLGLPAVGIDQDFFQLGGNSLLGVRLFALIEQKLGLRLPVSELFNSPTIRRLARFIESLPNGYKPSTLVMIRPGGPRRPLFLVHGWGGGVVDYADLARSIAPEWPVYGLQAAGLTREEAPDTTMEAMVNRYVSAIQTIQPHGPYRLGGYCTGGVIAYALACRFAALGEPVDVVAIIEGEAPGLEPKLPPLVSIQRLSTITRSIPFWLSDYRQLGLPGLRQRFLKKLRARQRAQRANGAGEDSYQMEDIILDNPTPLPDVQKELLLIELRMMAAYQPECFPGRVSVHIARYPTITNAISGVIDPSQGWETLALGGVSVYTVGSTHRNIHLAPYCRELARDIQHELEQADEVLQDQRAASG